MDVYIHCVSQRSYAMILSHVLFEKLFCGNLVPVR